MATVLMALAAILYGLTACRSSDPPSLQGLRIGSPPLESSALIYVAEDQRLFARHGLAVTVRNYETGVAALDGLVNGEADIAVPAEYALVGKAFSKEKIHAIASIDRVEYFELIARRDRGIQDISDLRGKTIGVVRHTIAEYYLGRFLELHALGADEVTLVDVSIAQSDAAIASGRVDAVIARPPTVKMIESHLGSKVAVWKAQGSQALYALLIARAEWTARHPEPVRQLYRALVEAEEFLIERPDEAKAIVKKRLNLNDVDVDAIWSQNQFSLTLDQSLILAMEDEARWMIQNNLTTERTIPDFLDYVLSDSLKAVKPQAVNIIR